MLTDWESGLSTTSRHDAGAEMPPATSPVMQINEARLNFQLIHFDAADRLANARQLLAYLTAGLPDSSPETLWIVAMNPNRRPICRMRIKSGVLVATQCRVADVFLPLLLAEAKSFVCLRTHRDGALRPNLADGRLVWNLHETAKLMSIELVDYFIARLGSHEYYSWREHDRHAA